MAQSIPQVKPTIGIGIDFGTSNSAAAIYDGEVVVLVELGRDNAIMPSANYLDKDLVTEIGQQAIDDYIMGNRGRTCLLYTSPSPRDEVLSRMPSSA